MERFCCLAFAVQVVAQIVGDEPLPRADTKRAKQLLKTAGQFRTPLLTLLRRDPLERPSIAAFLQHCSRLASSTTRSPV
jgi:hypothetical protein